EESQSAEDPTHFYKFSLSEFLFLGLHELRSEHGVDDQGDKQGGAQNYGKGNGEDHHELPDCSRPEAQWEEGCQGGGRGGDDRPGDLSQTLFGGIYARHPLTHQGIYVLY